MIHCVSSKCIILYLTSSHSVARWLIYHDTLCVILVLHSWSILMDGLCALHRKGGTMDHKEQKQPNKRFEPKRETKGVFFPVHGNTKSGDTQMVGANR